MTKSKDVVCVPSRWRRYVVSLQLSRHQRVGILAYLLAYLIQAPKAARTIQSVKGKYTIANYIIHLLG